MQKSKFTDFGLCVKTELIQRGMSQCELEQIVSRETGLFVDSGYMYKILTGKRAPEKIISCICTVLNIRNPNSTTKPAL